MLVAGRLERSNHNEQQCSCLGEIGQSVWSLVNISTLGNL